MNSDKSGVFNAYALPVSGGEAIQLTDSTDNAIFGESWFPDEGQSFRKRENRIVASEAYLEFLETYLRGGN